MKKILVAIESCQAHIPRHTAMEETWLKDLPEGIDYRFFIGGISGPLAENTVQLDVNDSYEALSLKTQEIFRWSVYHDYDFIFKADTDTLVSVKNLLDSGFKYHYYSGGFNEDLMPPTLRLSFPQSRIQFASGGAGYWLDWQSACCVSRGPKVASPAEDVYVAAVLSQNGILAAWNPGYRWRPGETVDENMISLHLSSALQKKYEPVQMYEYYEKIA